MAYYLTVEKKKGKFVPLNISLASCFSRLSKLKEDRATLYEIDCFTSQFKDEGELRLLLAQEEILDVNDLSRGLSIRRLENGKYIKVRHGLLFQRDIDYILSPEKLIERINDKLLSGDFRFVERYAYNYAEYRDCRSTAHEVSVYIGDSIRFGERSKYLDKRDENGDTPLVRMTKLLIYEYYQALNGRIFYQDKVKYRNLHSIIAFTNNYDDTHADNQEEIVFSNTGTKKRIRKKEDIEQFSMFD